MDRSQAVTSCYVPLLHCIDFLYLKMSFLEIHLFLQWRIRQSVTSIDFEHWPLMFAPVVLQLQYQSISICSDREDYCLCERLIFAYLRKLWQLKLYLFSSYIQHMSPLLSRSLCVSSHLHFLLFTFSIENRSYSTKSRAHNEVTEAHIVSAIVSVLCVWEHQHSSVVSIQSKLINQKVI